MSGPKIDFAQLERQRKAELERQRQEQLRLMAEWRQLQLELEALQAKCRKAQNENTAMGKELKNMTLQVVAHQAHVKNALQAIERANEFLLQLINALRRQSGMGSAPSTDDNIRLRQLLQGVGQQLEQVQRQVQADVRMCMQDVYQLKEKQRRAQQRTSITFEQVQAIALVPVTLAGSGTGGDIDTKNIEEQIVRYDTLKPFIQSALDHSAYLFAQDRKDFYTALKI